MYLAHHKNNAFAHQKTEKAFNIKTYTCQDPLSNRKQNPQQIACFFIHSH